MVRCDGAFHPSNQALLRTGIPLLRVSRLLRLALWLALTLSFAWAADDTTRQVLDSTRVALTDIDAALKAENLTDAELARLRAENDPLAARLQAVIADIAPRLEASRKRLVELTPKSKETTASNDAVTQELKDEQAKHDALDADLRSARAMLLQADDNGGRIGAARRDLFARQTFARSSSVLSPILWTSLASEARGDLAMIGDIFRDWALGLSQRLTAVQAFEILALTLFLLGAIVPVRWVARRVITRDPSVAAPSRLRRAIAAIWTILVVAGLPLAGLGVVSYALDVFDISDPRLQGGVDSLFDALRLLALGNAFGRGLLAPRQANWRLAPLHDRVVTSLFRFLIVACVIWGAEKLFEPAADAVASLNIAIAARALAATLIAIAALRTLRQIATPTMATAGVRDPWAPARTLAWAWTALTLGASLTGYIAFTTFLINQTFLMAAVGSTLYLADALVQESAEILLRPDAAIGRVLMTTVGLRRDALEQIVVLVQGFARLAALIAALVFALGPLGLPSQDFVATMRAAYFGFTIGGVTVSLSSMLAAATLFVVVVIATRGAQNWLDQRYLPRTRLDAGVRNSIRTITGYIGVVIALLISGSRVGLDLQKFALVAGALSVGIGFGLQGIVNNFVSGLILLWERGIRVGDWVVVGAEQGFVRSINARATEIETFDRSTLIVPNSTLVTTAIKNWMHTDRVARIAITVNVDYNSDPESVRELLISAAKAQDLVLSIPSPIVIFSDFGDWALKFHLYCYVDDALIAERVKSELNFDILRRLRESGMRTPYPYPTPK